MSFGFGFGFPRRVGAALRAALDFNFLSGQLDPRITFTRASTGTYVNSSGVLSSAAINGPRFDYDPVTLAPKGLLIEEQRTNSIRNNTMQGAIAGTPGTVPTNWSVLFNTTTGVTRTVVGTGTEDGIAYIDISLVGTASGAGSVDFFFEEPNSIAAVTGQIWGASLYWKIAAGSLTGLSTPIFYTYEYNSSIGFVNAPIAGSPALPTTAPLRTQRFRGAATLSGGATTAFVRPLVKLNIAAGAAINITLRIGLPQLELGAFATSVIPTTTIALTRAADVAAVTGANFSSWYNAVEGTTYVEASTLPGVTAAALTHAISDGTFNQSIYGNFNAGNLYIGANVLNGGVNQASGIGPFSIAASTNVTKDAFAYKQNNFGESCNGATPKSDLTGTIPTVNRLYIGSNWSGVGNFLNGHIRSFAYYPTRLSDATLQSLTYQPPTPTILAHTLLQIGLTAQA